LIVSFETKELREICELEEEAKARFGNIVALKLQHRLADIFAANNVCDIPVGNPHEVEACRTPTYQISLVENFCIRIVANQKKVPVLENGSVDWNNVMRVKIISIQKEHDQ